MSYGQDQSQGYGQNAMVPAGGGGLQAPAFSHANYKITRPWLSILGRKFYVYAPDGSLDRVLDMPVSRPSCCAFGGAELRTLFVTSARVGMSDAELEKDPYAGSLYRVELEDALGLPADLFAI